MDEGVIFSNTTEELSNIIKPINKESVHKICSGQVVLSLAIAVKELVENSIDANATLIEVKLKDHGLESVEVSDNGSGVEKSNFESMTAKYHTSKIRKFSDLEEVATFGFRGEALSSLCALSNMSIITRHSSVEIGTKLELDNRGQIIKHTPIARQVGTTVILTNLFCALPVRRKEFTKNIKKEFTKMCQILQAYCLISKGIRIICSNQCLKGFKTTILSTSGSQSVLENIQSVFGSKQTSEIIEINSDMIQTKMLIDEISRDNNDIEVTPAELQNIKNSGLKIESWISSCKHENGRSSKDRQFFFINSRPCEPNHIIKLVNEIYHRYNSHHYPFVVFNLIIDRSDVDVNVTPDKRKLLVNNEKMLLLIIKKLLINTFDEIPSSYTIQNSSIGAFASQKQEIKNNSDDDNIDDDEGYRIKPNNRKFAEIFSQWKATGNTNEPCKPLKPVKRKPDEILARNFKLKKIQEYLTQAPKTDNNEDKFGSYKSDSESDTEVDPVDEKLEDVNITKTKSLAFDIFTQEKGISDKKIKPAAEEIIKDKLETMHDGKEENIISCKVKTEENEKKLITETQSIFDTDEDTEESDIILDSQLEGTSPYMPENSEIITITIEKIRQLLLEEEESNFNKKYKSNLKRLKFKSEINPNQNDKAVKELEREISKDMFAQMEIIGQFNLGFIISKLDNDLFIIDQHATDEKYNFEELQKKTYLHTQKLAVPQNLELNAVNEMILIDNIKVFEANGFKFKLDENAPVTKKVKLLAKPFSKNWEFGKSDIEELIFMLQDAPTNTMCRPSRINSMLASRACRKSVMIGKPLTNATMKQLVRHMGEIDQPWNCPHGRPTMRHLVNLDLLETNTNDTD